LDPAYDSFTEGDIHILVPHPPSDKIDSDMPAFYNPVMATNRDIAIIAARAFAQSQPGPLTVCDLLSATGIRGLRYLGVRGLGRLYMNDIRKTAFELMMRNLKNNFDVDLLKQEADLVGAKAMGKEVWISRKEALLFLAEHKHFFDILDLDPFGSPAPFLPASLKAMRHGSLLCVTATDTATLCGTYPKTCVRRYGSKPLRTAYKHEVGLRVLIGYVVRQAASMDVGANPIFSHATAHYYRVYFSIKGSRSAADRALSLVGWGAHCENCLSRSSFPGFLPPSPTCCGRPMRIFGPLWLGPIKERGFVKSMSQLLDPADLGEAAQIVRRVSDEIDTFSFYDLHAFAKDLSIPAPPTSRILQALRDRGFLASPTHITGTGLKTDASAKELRQILTASS